MPDHPLPVATAPLPAWQAAPPHDTIIVRSAADMAAWLRATNATPPRDFARAMHERACWDADDSRAQFWREVGRLLRD